MICVSLINTSITDNLLVSSVSRETIKKIREGVAYPPGEGGAAPPLTGDVTIALSFILVEGITSNKGGFYVSRQRRLFVIFELWNRTAVINEAAAHTTKATSRKRLTVVLPLIDSGYNFFNLVTSVL